MKTYEICVSYTTYQYHSIRANSEEEALELSHENENFKEHIDNMEVSVEGIYDENGNEIIED